MSIRWTWANITERMSTAELIRLLNKRLKDLQFTLGTTVIDVAVSPRVWEYTESFQSGGDDFGTVSGFFQRESIRGSVITPNNTGAPTRALVPWGQAIQYVSIAGALGTELTGTAANTRLNFPLDFYAGSYPTPAQGTRLYRRYLLTLPVRITTQGTAVVELQVCNANAASLFAAAIVGGVWQSDPSVNSGRWRPTYRLTSGGSQLFGADSGVSPLDAIPHCLGLRFTEGPGNPTMEWLIDGTVYLTLTGSSAQLFTMAAAGVIIRSQLVVGPVVGTTVQRGGVRWLVEEIGV